MLHTDPSSYLHKTQTFEPERSALSVQCICPFQPEPRPSICFYFVPFLLSREAKATHPLVDHLLVSVCQVPSFGSSVCMLSSGMHIIHAADQRCHTVDLSTADIQTSIAHSICAAHPLCMYFDRHCRETCMTATWAIILSYFIYVVETMIE